MRKGERQKIWLRSPFALYLFQKFISVSMRTAILLINLGSPENASRKAVGSFLFQMLNDKFVIDLPFVLRKLLVNLIIIPFRINASSNRYKEYFGDKKSSPLLETSFSIAKKLNNTLPENYQAFIGMRYGKPSLKKALSEIEKKQFDKIILFPQYPQYAEATTRSSIEKVEEIVSKFKNKPDLQIIKQFYNNPLFITCFANKIKQFNLKEYDHLIFSYHSLPLRQINKIHPDIISENCNCTQEKPKHGEYCYKSACYETSRLLAEQLHLQNKDYTVSFQSQMGKDWLQPFTDNVLIKKAKDGCKRILIVSPSFVTDCLETTMDLQIEYNVLFKQHGGEHLQLVESLNDDNSWVEALMKITMN